jgi:hypothetical protein
MIFHISPGKRGESRSPEYDRHRPTRKYACGLAWRWKPLPLRCEEIDPEELTLVASGQMTLPNEELDQKRFWAIGGRAKWSQKIANAIQRVIAAEREDYAGVLGHKRHHSHLRARTKHPRG